MTAVVVERPLGLILVLEGQRGIDFHMQAHVVLIRSWVSANQAGASQAAYYRHEWKYRFSSAMQKWNGRMLADGKARVGQA